MSMGMKSIYASIIGSIFRASDVPSFSFAYMRKRHKKDMELVDPNYEDKELTEFIPIYQTVFDDDRDPMHEPTFAKHRIPL